MKSTIHSPAARAMCLSLVTLLAITGIAGAASMEDFYKREEIPLPEGEVSCRV